MPRKLLFIVNPNAGKKISGDITQVIRKAMPADLPYKIEVWKDKDYFSEIARALTSEKFTDAIAVGGDGTVNHVAKTILGTGITLGILPIGSGNGLARTLGISMKIDEALRQVIEGRNTRMDHGSVNGSPFFCTSGIGFDAHIGQLFALSLKRGLRSYVSIIITQLMHYQAKEYVLVIDGQIFKRKAFLITVANAGQYGNNFYIAPMASLQDGLFHVAILRPFNLFTAFGLFTKIILRKAHKSRYIETHTAKRVMITRVENGPVHFDGEPVAAGREVVFEMHHLALSVIVGDTFITT